MGRYIPNAFNLWVVIYVALGSTACSYGMAILGSTIGQPSFYKSMKLAAEGEPGYARTANLIGAFNGVCAAGSALGAVFNSWSADRFSRKYTIQIGAVITLLGAALSGGSVNVAMFIVARFIAGLGIGILICVIPMYQSEVSTPDTRGFMVSMHGVMFAVGYSLSAWISLGVYFVSASGSESTFPWRFPLAFQGAPALLLLIGSRWLPFSPRWLMEKGRFQEAEDVLQRLHARKNSKQQGHQETVIKEFHQIRKQIELDREMQMGASWYAVFKTAANRKRFLVATLLMWGNMFTGVLFVANYSIILFGQLGLGGYMPLLLLAALLTMTFPGNILTALLIDRWGRRNFLLLGISGIVCSLTLEAIILAKYLDSTNKAGQRAGVFLIYLFTAFWCTCVDATQYLYLSEIFPTYLRGKGVAVGMVSYYCASIIILVAGPIALHEISWKFLLVFIIPTALYVVAIYYLFPETRQRSLEDINVQFGDKVAIRYFDATEEDEKEYQHAVELEEVDLQHKGHKDDHHAVELEQVEMQQKHA